MVVWESGILYGCAFEQTLDQRALSSLQLRADPAVVPSGMPFESPGVPSSAPLSGREADGLLETPPEPLGVRLNRLRRERGLTLAQVADSLGVSKPTVWAWEKGKARPLPDRIEPIAEVLEVDPAELAEQRGEQQHSVLVEDCRVRIATAYGTHPAKVRIMIEV
jgi:DNA-binding XRE family transcriptional regulator